MSVRTLFTKQGVSVPCIEPDHYLSCLESLLERYSISPLQIAEAASYSMAMVVRFALGLSARDAYTTVIVTDSLAGQVALATLRHLVHGGADGTAIFLSPPDTMSKYMSHQIKNLLALGLEPIFGEEEHLNESLKTEIKRSHNVICGIGTTGSLPRSLTETLNDAFTPVHCVELPPGVCPASGQLTDPLFASSTLSLGAPLHGLHEAQENVGRLYICDISLPIYPLEELGYTYPLLFDDQPVQQLLWAQPE
jgi:NAD(P)H-hydrate repair Nnr-like enzyme with NAD(P)H-hydrate epimerase domain